MPLVIFDMDGTLIDSVALIVETVTNAFEAISADIRVQTPAQFADFIRAENLRWGSLIQKLGIKLD